MNVEDIKLREIQVFLNLLKLKSVRELGRQYNIQPGQVSKMISGLEVKIGSPLFERSAMGLQPTVRALELLPYFQKMGELQESLSQVKETSSDETSFVFGSSSFFSTHLIPIIIRELDEKQSQRYKVRVIDLPPSQLIPIALRGAFEYCLHSVPLDWPKTWSTVKVGSLNWQMYGRKNHAAAKNPTLKEVKKHPFIIPLYWTAEGTRYGEDQCPIPLGERKKGHETATAASALEIVKVTNQLAFLPDIVAQMAVERDEVEIIPVPSLPLVKRPVYLSVKSATVKQKNLELLQDAAKKALKI